MPPRRCWTRDCEVKPLLELHDLHASYGTDAVLNGIDLTLGEGDSLAIIGESGTGKTTLGMSIMRMSEARVRGSITFDGLDLLSLPDDEVRKLRWNRISMVFQNVDNVLDPLYTVLDQVAEPMIEHGLRDKKDARERAGALLERFGIPARRFDAYPHQLSGGQQQRVLLAMALTNDPDLVIMDEPLSSLDVTTRNELAEIIAADTERARLVITHDLDTAGRLARNVAVLYGGRIVEYGPTDEVLAEPRHPYTRALLRSYPNMTTVKDLQGIKGQMTRPVSGCPFHPRCTQAQPSCGASVPALTGDGRKTACHRGGIVTLLSISGLSLSYDGFTAVDSADLEVKSGETVSLVGQSGSGKTTLAKSIIGLLEPSSGKISLEGEATGKDHFKRVQMIFQNPGESLSHRLSVVELVMEPLDVQNIGTKEERRKKAVKTIGEVQLPQTEAFLTTYAHHLSGGELQRVAVARALVLDPDLLIADEPTAFLDASLSAKILKLLLNLQEQRGLSILFITHDIAAARKVSDRIAVMEAGKIIEMGPASRITTSPATPYTKRLLEAAARLSRD